MTLQTLKQIYMGGIWDQLGGGLHRYSTDREWFLPHFEKMLYDQAMAVITLSEASHFSDDPWLKTMTDEVITFLADDLSAPDGAFFSSLDADSESGEGDYYTWSYRELEEILSENQLNEIKSHFGVKENGNFNIEATGQTSGRNIFHRTTTEEMLPDSIALTLKAARDTREKPATDDKILADWNGLMIAALARAARAFSKSDYLEIAINSAKFIDEKMTTAAGELLHSHRNGKSSVDGMLDDYAMVSMGFLELHKTTLENIWLKLAIDLTQRMIHKLTEPDTWGFVSSEGKNSLLPGNTVPVQDGAIPCGNAIALGNLIRIHDLTGNKAIGSALDKLRDHYSSLLERHPTSSPTALAILADRSAEPVMAVVLGGGNDPLKRELINAIKEETQGRVAILSGMFQDELLTSLAPYTASMTTADGRAAAWVCSNGSCSLPVQSVLELKKLIRRDADRKG